MTTRRENTTVVRNIEATRSSIQKNSNGTINIDVSAGEEGGGFFAVASRDIRRGEHIATSPSVAIALNSTHISSRCGYCARKVLSSTTTTTTTCDQCCMISVCSLCQTNGMGQWHTESGECEILKSFLQSYTLLLLSSTSSRAENGEGDTTPTTTVPPVTIEEARQVDMTYVLCLRCLHRRFVDEELQKNSLQAQVHLPSIDWNVFDALYESDESYNNNNNDTMMIVSLCDIMSQILRQSSSESKSISFLQWTTKKNMFHSVLAKVVGCGHAITDISLDLGEQDIGRAIFVEQSFYNHSCSPNGFLSCQLAEEIEGEILPKKNHHPCAVVSRVHCIQQTKQGNAVTLSYIPMSGLDKRERKMRLKQNYDFECQCFACRGDSSVAKEWEKYLFVPVDNSDIDSVREVQYSIHNRLMELLSRGVDNKEEEEKHETLDWCKGLLDMNTVGLKRLEIAPSHELSIELHRLRAVASSLAGDTKTALHEYELCCKAIKPVQGLFDPVSLASILLQSSSLSSSSTALVEAYELASAALGIDHPYCKMIQQKMEESKSSNAKRARMG